MGQSLSVESLLLYVPRNLSYCDAVENELQNHIKKKVKRLESYILKHPELPPLFIPGLQFGSEFKRQTSLDIGDYDDEFDYTYVSLDFAPPEDWSKQISRESQTLYQSLKGTDLNVHTMLALPSSVIPFSRFLEFVRIVSPFADKTGTSPLCFSTKTSTRIPFLINGASSEAAAALSAKTDDSVSWVSSQYRNSFDALTSPADFRRNGRRSLSITETVICKSHQQKKVVRFADCLGLELEHIRSFVQESLEQLKLGSNAGSSLRGLTPNLTISPGILGLCQRNRRDSGSCIAAIARRYSAANSANSAFIKQQRECSPSLAVSQLCTSILPKVGLLKDLSARNDLAKLGTATAADKTNPSPNTTPTSKNGRIPQQTDKYPKFGASFASVGDLYHLSESNSIARPFGQDICALLGDRYAILESLALTSSAAVGTVLVANVAFEKRVFVRYTYDSWKHFEEFGCSFMEERHTQVTDCFCFQFQIVKLHNVKPNNGVAVTTDKCNRFVFSVGGSIIGPAIQFSIRFTAGTSEYWDNNNGQNYLLSLTTVSQEL